MSVSRPVAEGFTLIEMAIVLVVIGLILSGGLVAITPIMQNSRVTETNAQLDRIEQALILYAAQNSCLPCPADGSIATGNTGYGQARFGTGSGTAYSSGCASGTNTCWSGNGVVPWMNLGLSESDVTDAWGNRLTYYLSNGTTTTCTSAAIANRNTNLQSSGGFSRSATVTSCYPRGSVTVTNASGTDIVIGGGSAEGAAYVLVSHGPDGLGARKAETGAALGAPVTGSRQEENADDDSTFVQDTRIDADGTYFDDLVRWRTAPMVIQLCGTNSCGNPA